MEGDQHVLTLWDAANVDKYKTLSSWLFQTKGYRIIEDKPPGSYQYFSSDLQMLEKGDTYKAENPNQQHKSSMGSNTEIIFQTLEKYDRRDCRITKGKKVRHKDRKIQ